MIVRRVLPGEEETWLEAVRALVGPELEGNKGSRAGGISELLADPRCYLFVARDDAIPLGLIVAYRFPDAQFEGYLAYLYDIVVHREHRKQGIGTLLVSTLLDACRQDGVRTIWAGTDRFNMAARNLFEKCGAVLERETYAEYAWSLKEVT